MKPACSIPDCDKPAKGRGWCAMHWYRWRKYGDPLKVAQRGVDWQVRPTCSVEGCDRPHHAKSFCSMHHARWTKHGDPLHIEPITGRPLVGDVPTIAAIHKRLTRTQGPASGHLCVDCDARADDWSYNNTDPDEHFGISGGSVVAYSLDLANYDPRCRSCHRVFDQAGQRARDADGRFAATGARISITPLDSSPAAVAPPVPAAGEAPTPEPQEVLFP